MLWSPALSQRHYPPAHHFRLTKGKIGLVTRYGEIQETKSAGLHWRSWLEDDVVFSTREQKVTIGKFDDVGDITSGISAYTRDTQNPSPRR